jgi:hypothetical protein
MVGREGTNLVLLKSRYDASSGIVVERTTLGSSRAFDRWILTSDRMHLALFGRGGGATGAEPVIGSPLSAMTLQALRVHSLSDGKAVLEAKIPASVDPGVLVLDKSAYYVHSPDGQHRQLVAAGARSWVHQLADEPRIEQAKPQSAGPAP